MSKKYAEILIFFLLVITFTCKPKTELYLERGLDILSNKKEVNFKIHKNIAIKEIGVIRDKKNSNKTLVFKLNSSTTEDVFKDINELGVRVWITDDNGAKRIENWDFRPKLVQVKEHKYILKEIKIKEGQIRKMKIYMYQEIDKKKHKIGDSLMLNKVNTYND